MTKITKLFMVALIAGIPLLSSAQLAFAVDPIDLDTVAGFAGVESTTTLAETIGTIINTILSLLGVLVLVIVLYAGFLWMTAGGEEKQVKKAKDWLINGVIGLVLVLAAYALSNFVIDALMSATGVSV